MRVIRILPAMLLLAACSKSTTPGILAEQNSTASNSPAGGAALESAPLAQVVPGEVAQVAAANGASANVTQPVASAPKAKAFPKFEQRPGYAIAAELCAPNEPGAGTCSDPMDIDPLRHYGKAPGLRDGAVPVDSGLHHCGFCEQEVTSDDACATAQRDANWYGLWEDAVAESKRTGKPLLVHMGSPRHIRVSGVW